jgi:C4-dicarboxylate transporter/malic acid transport protein
MGAVVRQFTPNWFTVTMGTGILALMLAQLSPTVPAAHAIAVTLWFLNIALFGVFALLFGARAMWFPKSMADVFLDPSQSMFTGAIPMGLATIGNGFVVFGPALFGATSIHVAEALWGVDALLAILSGTVIPYLMFNAQEHSLEKMSALWLLPIVPAEVTAASAGLLVPHVAHADQQALLIAGTLLWAFSVPLALAILAILFLRLALHKIPQKELGVSGWLTLGPLATGSLALVLLGENVKYGVAGTPLAAIAGGAEAFGIIAGLMLWSYGAWWWIVGIAITLHHVRRELPFNMGWWAFTFPLGVYTASTYALASVLSSHVFQTLAIALTLILAALWILVAARTIHNAFAGSLRRRQTATIEERLAA